MAKNCRSQLWTTPNLPVTLQDRTGCNDGSGGPSCCTSYKQCGKGEGDCDSDADCAGNLKCGQGNGLDDNCDTSLGFPSDYDCCYDPSNG